jgi:hypothetical protein
MTKKNLWMQEAFKNAGKGTFHKQLGVPTNEKIPMTFLQAIVKTEIGMYAHNPTNTGYKMVKVTHLKKKRANALLNADRANK